MKTKPTIKTPIPTASGFHNFALYTLHFDFPTPKPPIHPSLPPVPLSLIPCALPPFVPSCPCGQQSITQNKPNSQNAEIHATSYATKIYENIPLRSARKNKPNQTQSRTQVSSIFPALRNTRYAIRDTNPISPPRRFTLHACPLGEIRDTNPIPPRYDIRHPPAPKGGHTLAPLGLVSSGRYEALMPYIFAWSRMRSLAFWLGRLSAP